MLCRNLYRIGFVLLVVFTAGPGTNADSGPGWLERLNLYRAAALLPWLWA